VDPAPAPTAATVTISTRGASADTVIYGVEFTLHLPTGGSVAADQSGAVLASALRATDSGALVGARYIPATASSQPAVLVNILDSGGFPVGSLAALSCRVLATTAVSAADFSLDGFSARDANGAAIPGVTPFFSVQTQ